MKVAVAGSRNKKIDNLGDYLPDGTDCIISGGARGIDTCAAQYAHANGIKLREILPDYETYGRRAPILRNVDIINEADFVLVFWDGKSPGSRFVIEHCRRINKPFRIEYV